MNQSAFLLGDQAFGGIGGVEGRAAGECGCFRRSRAVEAFGQGDNVLGQAGPRKNRLMNPSPSSRNCTLKNAQLSRKLLMNWVTRESLLGITLSCRKSNGRLFATIITKIFSPW
jgi:hypothetical protein